MRDHFRMAKVDAEEKISGNLRGPEPFREIDLNDIIHEVLSDLEIKIVKVCGEVQVEELPAIAADPHR
jgi:light-regulated signal transduction histidine kinase (bacteriophytochrome)